MHQVLSPVFKTKVNKILKATKANTDSNLWTMKNITKCN